jgi:hypothetical protein
VGGSGWDGEGKKEAVGSSEESPTSIILKKDAGKEEGERWGKR